MNWVLAWKAATTFRNEVRIVLIALAVLLSLPLISVVVIANAGVAAVSEALVSVNPVTHSVEIRSPNGNTFKELKLSTIWPVDGIVTDEFGTHGPFRIRLGLGSHTGIDIANAKGAPVTPFMNGTVISVDNTDDSACGINVKIDHGSGIKSLYCHLSDTATTSQAKVKPGDVIGYVGSTGASTGAHLHFQIMVYDIPVNPRTFMAGEVPPGN